MKKMADGWVDGKIGRRMDRWMDDRYVNEWTRR